MPRVLDLAVELAIREEPRAALAELHVRLRGQRALAPQPPRVLGAAADIAAALEHDGSIALLREHQRREQPTGTEADHERLLEGRCGRRRGRAERGVGRGYHMPVVAVRREHPRLVTHRHIDDIDEGELAVLAPRIVAALEDGEGPKVRLAQAEALEDGAAQGVLGARLGGVAPGERQLGDADHGPFPGRWSRQRPRIALVYPYHGPIQKQRQLAAPSRH